MTAQTRTAKLRSTEAVQAPARGEFTRRWLLAAYAALVVARPLLPSEGVSWIGDGQPFNLAWLVVGVLVCLWMAVSLPSIRRPGVVDVAVAALAMLCWTSAIASGWHEGSPRFLVNMGWEWTSLALVFLIARQLLRTGSEARALAAVMIALAVVVSWYGYYQVYVTLPADRAAYAADPDGMLRQAGQWYPPGSQERARFESRLASTEPLATFALTNSLAGFLAPWLIVGLEALIALATDRPPPHAGVTRATAAVRRLRWVALAVCLLAVAGCLLLTKSRSAYLATMAGLAIVPLAAQPVRRRLDRRLVIAAGGLVALLIVAAIATRGLDAPVLTEAAKSLGYRLEYWQSTLAMIRRHFWLGVGPGNFQDFYTQYKLPYASEEIRDPHNLVLEVWATCGTLAMISFCTALVGTVWFAWRGGRGDQLAAESAGSSPPDNLRGPAFIAGGAAAGFLVAFLVGPMVGMVFSEEQLLAGILIGGVVVTALWPWIVSGTWTPRLPALGMIVLAVHLLASGGIAIPGVAYSFWLLAALALNAVELPSDAAAGAGGGVAWRFRAIALALAAMIGGGAVACYVFAFRPVVRCHEAMAKAADLAASEPQSPAIRVLWLDAANADPWSPEPWSALAELELARIRRNPDDETAHTRLTNIIDNLNKNRPHSSAVQRQIGGWLNEVDEIEHEPERAGAAARYLRRAVSLYPNSATTRGEYALALVKTEQLSEARRQAELALSLDARMPHADKKLPAELKQKLESLQSGERAEGDAKTRDESAPASGNSAVREPNPPAPRNDRISPPPTARDGLGHQPLSKVLPA